KLPEMSLPSPSTVAVWPAIQTTRPPSVTTAGEYARFFCASVPSRYFAMSAPFSRVRECGEYRTLVADPLRGARFVRKCVVGRAGAPPPAQGTGDGESARAGLR